MHANLIPTLNPGLGSAHPKEQATAANAVFCLPAVCSAFACYRGQPPSSPRALCRLACRELGDECQVPQVGRICNSVQKGTDGVEKGTDGVKKRKYSR